MEVPTLPVLRVPSSLGTRAHGTRPAQVGGTVYPHNSSRAVFWFGVASVLVDAAFAAVDPRLLGRIARAGALIPAATESRRSVGCYRMQDRRVIRNAGIFFDAGSRASALIP
jgi:hypothetical protein